ncbi:MAG: phosphatase PAP2 family protein [Saprospiraceae bacterium]|nr:phosphatase PAP2 family protein [Bacteroidia bacterium]NNE16150.1 phosphatase PAP2 family protein [Saprospiraceae bacterium]NNL92374.1 phosphatase PAP2 family protein [Saprospiraceae bacterium]
MRLIKRLVIILLISSFALNASFGQDEPVYNFTWKKEKYVFGASIGLIGAAYVIDRSQETITVGEVNALDRLQINSLERPAIDRFNTSSAKLSDRYRDGVFLVPLTIFLTSKGRNEWQNIASLYLETLAVNTSLTTIAQAVVSKERPFIYNENLPIEERTVRSARRSFYSGHVSHVSSLSFFTAKVLTDLYPNAKNKWLTWTAAASLPAITAYLRYDAGKHFLSDVLVGYGVGAVVGILVPKMHKIKSDNLSISLLPQSDGMSLGMGLTF